MQVPNPAGLDKNRIDKKALIMIKMIKMIDLIITREGFAMDVSATEFKRKLGQYLDAAERSPVIIKKSGRVKSVLISNELYQKFMALEDAFWTQRAKQAEAGGYLGEDETDKLLKRLG